MDKFIQGAIKVGVAILAIVLLVILFRVAWNFVWYGSATLPAASVSETMNLGQQSLTQSEIRRSQAGGRKHNEVKQQWLRDCEANNAPVTQLGGGRMNCYREPTVRTYID